MALCAPAALAAQAQPALTTLTLSSSSTSTVGAPVAYQFAVPIPQGTTTTLTVTATLPNGLVFVQGTNFAVNGTTTCTNVTCTLPVPVVGGGHSITWTFSNVVDANVTDTFSWEIDAVVDNVTAAIADAELAASATVVFTDGSGASATNTSQSASAAAVLILEPTMSFTASVAPGTGDASDTFVVSVHMVNSPTNHNANGATETGTDAYNVTAAVSLPSGLAGVSGSFNIGNCPGSEEGVASKSGVTVSNGQVEFGEIPLNTSCTFTFSVQMLGTVNPAQTLTATINGTWTSQSGVPMQESNYSSTSSMRTGNTLDAGGSLNDYLSSSTFSLNVTPLSLALTLDTPAAAVAAPVSYGVVVTVPQGTTPSLTLVDTLPPGLTYVGASSFTASANLSFPTLNCSGSSCVAPTPTVNGQIVTYALGEVVNSGTSDATPETIAFTINTVVANVSAATAAHSPLASSTIYVEEAPSVTSSAAQDVSVLEPALTFSQSTVASSSPALPQAGDTLTTTVTVNNPSSSSGTTAYETTILYTLPAGGQLNPLSATGSGSNPCTIASTALVPTSASIVLGPIGLGTSCTFNLVTQLTTAAAPNEVETATFRGTWSSAANVVGQRDGNPNDPGANLNTYVQTNASFSITTGVPTVSISNGSTLTASVGGLVASHIIVTLPQGTTPSIVINASLPPGLVFQQGANFAASGSLACGTATCGLPAPVVTSGGHAVQWTFTNVVDSDTNDGTHETLSWDLDSIVENNSNAMAGDQFTTSVAYTVGTATGNASTAPVTVTEPKLSFSVSSTPAAAAGNDLVTVTVTILNSQATANGATAYDTAVNFMLPSGKLSAVAGSYQQGTCPQAAATLVGTNASFVFASLPVAAASCSFTYQAQLSTGVVENEVESATGTATWTSQPGAVTTSESSYASDATERTGNAGNIGGQLNSYAASGLNFSVTASTSSFAFTGPASATAAVGAPVTYHASAIIPQGTTPELDVTVNLTPGLVFQQGANLVASAGIRCAGAVCALPAPTVTNNGYTATWALKNIVNSNSDDSGSDTIGFDVIGIVENDATSQAGNTYSASANFATGQTTASLTAGSVTVIEPSLAVTSTATSTSAQGNDVVTINVNVVNANIPNGATAYNATTTFALPAGKLTPVANGYSQGTCPLATQTLTSAAAQFAFASIPLNSSCSFSFQVRLLVGVIQGETETVAGSVTWTSQPVAVAAAQSIYAADSSERTGNQSDIGTTLNKYAKSQFGFAITVPTSTFQYTGPAAATAAVGGAVVYHAYATIPRGTTPEVQLTVDFPTGLAFQQGENLVASNGIFCGGIACALRVPTVGSNGSSATWTLSNVTDTNPSSSTVDTIQWDVVSIVENDSTAQAGVTLSNTGSYVVGATNGAFSSNTVTVVEPSLTFSTTSTPALAAANDLVTVTVQVKNPTTTNGATAYDAVATYTLPAGKLTAATGSYLAGSCPTATPTLAGTNASFYFASIPLGTTCSFSFQAQLADSINPLETEVATAAATWTSQPGNLTQPQSTYASDTTERTGNPSDPGTTLNKYNQSGFGFSVATRGSTFSFTGPASPTAAVGGVVAYHVAAIIPQGTTPALTVAVTLPHGLVFQQGANFAATAGITCAGLACALPSPTVASGGYSVQWTLSNIVDGNSADTLSDTISWDVLAVVENDATSIAGATYVANATIAVGTNSASFTAQAVTVIEPHVVFTTVATPLFAGANDTVTVLVNLDNPASAHGADAYNVTATYTLATGKETAVLGSFQQGNCPAGQANLQGTTASFIFARLALGSGCQFSFQIRPTTGVLQAEQEVTTAIGTWTSQAVTGAPAQSTFATDSTERTGDPTGANDTLDNYRQTNFGFTITVPQSAFTFAGPSTPTAPVGAVVLYHAGATIPQATLNKLDLVVTLPPGLVFQQGTNLVVSNGITCGGLVCSLPTPTVTNAGHTVEWDVTDIVDSNAQDLTDSFEWDVATVVENDSVAVAGAQFVSSAVFTSDLTTQDFTTPALIVAEPAPVFAISGTPAPTAPLSSVLITVSVDNPLSATGTDAYDTTVSFALDAGQMTALAGSYQAGTCPAATATLSGTTASFVFADLPMTTSCTFSFGANVDASAAPSSTITATSLATWASQPGTTTPALSIYATDANRRTGNSTDPGGALNTYRQTGFDASVHVPAAYFNGGIGSQGGGCAGAGGSDLAWLGALFGLAALVRRGRRGVKSAS